MSRKECCSHRIYSHLYLILSSKPFAISRTPFLVKDTWEWNLAKTSFISHYHWNIWSLCCENHSIACSSSSGHWGVKQPIFACFADILSLPERIVAWSVLHHCTMDSLSPQSQVIFELFSTASASAITFILKVIVYKERRAFGMMRKITVMKEILDWNICQVTVTECIVVFLQLRSSIYIFTDLLFFFFFVYSHSLAFVFIGLFPNFSMRLAHSNGRLQSRISLSA